MNLNQQALILPFLCSQIMNELLKHIPDIDAQYANISILFRKLGSFCQLGPS